MRGSLLFCLALLVWCVPAFGSGDIYKWVDGEGRLHYTQDLGQVPPEYRREAQLSARLDHPAIVDLRMEEQLDELYAQMQSREQAKLRAALAQLVEVYDELRSELAR